MANSILGNNGACNYYLTEHETEVGDDEYEDLMGEFVDELDVFGYRAVTPKASQTTSVKIFFYYKAPNSEWYWDYMYGDPYDPIIPLVFSCDSNWKLTELLNSSTYEVTLAGRANGWIEMNVTLKRKLVKNERIFFGVYSDTLGVVHTHEDEDPTDNCYLYFSTARRSSYANQMAYVTSSQWLSNSMPSKWDFDICCYLQYENEFEGVAYSRTVLGNARALSGLEKRIFFFRALENTGVMSSSATRSCRMKIENADEFSLYENLQQLLLIIRSCFSGGGITESLEHKADYKRLPESVIDDLEEVTRCSESFRSASDDVGIEALPFASRLFFRTVQTVMSLWDWLRGKIREANNVITLFCPIDTEITLECRI